MNGEFKIEAKLVIPAKQSAPLPLSNLTVEVKWEDDKLDLDAMVFGTRKDGSPIVIFTNQLPRGNLGKIDVSPFIQHQGDDLGTSGGGGSETIKIAKLDDIKEAYICVMNYTDMSGGKESCFGDYHAGAVITPDKGDSMAVKLDSMDKGCFAVIGKIDCSDPASPKLVNENKVLDKAAFVALIPQAVTLFKDPG